MQLPRGADSGPLPLHMLRSAPETGALTTRERALQRERDDAQRELAALRRQGVIFRPMVWSAEGRPHPVTICLLENAVRLFHNRRSHSHTLAARDWTGRPKVENLHDPRCPPQAVRPTGRADIE